MVKTILFVLIAAILAVSVTAVVPPSNLWGYIYEDGARVSDTRQISVTGDCYGTGIMEVAQGETELGIGYYDIDIPMDDAVTVSDEGCIVGQSLTVEISGNPVAILSVGSSASSISSDIQIESVTIPDTQEGEGASGGGGGIGGASYPDLQLPEIRADMPDAIVMMPPFNLFGYVYIDGELVTVAYTVTATSDCYGNGVEVVAETVVDIEHGYYDLYVPIDTAGTDVDEGCDAGQIITMTIDGRAVEQPSTLQISGPGQSKEIDLVIGKKGELPRPAETEQPAETVLSPETEKRDLAFFGMLLLVIVAAGILTYQIHRKHEHEKA